METYNMNALNQTEQIVEPGHIYICTEAEHELLSTLISKQSIAPEVDKINIDCDKVFNDDAINDNYLSSNSSPVCIRPLSATSLQSALIKVSSLLSLSSENYLELFSLFLKKYATNLSLESNQPVNTVDDVIVLLQYDNVRLNVSHISDESVKQELTEHLNMLSDYGNSDIYNKILYLDAASYLKVWATLGDSNITSTINHDVETVNATVFVLNGELTKHSLTAIKYFISSSIDRSEDDIKIFISNSFRSAFMDLNERIKKCVSFLSPSEMLNTHPNI